MEPTAWDRFHVLFWVLIGIGIYLIVLIIIYLILKYALGKKLGSLGQYLSYLTWSLPFMPLGEITAYPKISQGEIN